MNTLPSMLQPGDCIGMIGDSITCDGRWWAAVRCGLQTEFPGCRLDFRNLAIPGDSAHETLERYEWDIAPIPIDVTFVMLGMNDVWRVGYADPQPPPEIVIKRRDAIRVYAESIAQLLGMLKKRGIRIVLLTSTPYEQEALLPESNLHGVDEALQECVGLARTLAADHGARFIDLHTPMLGLGRRLRRSDPSATLIGPDRVHPGVLGHAVMGRLVLNALLPADRSLAIEVNPWVENVNGDVVKLVPSTTDCIRWIYSGALPNPAIPDLVGELLQLPAPRLVWRIKTPPGRWTLWVEGESIHTAGGCDWVAGIDVGMLASPLRRKAQHLQRAGEELNDEEKRRRLLLMLRIWSQRSGGTGKGGDFIAYLDKLMSEQPPVHWLRDVVSDAKNWLASESAHEETVATLRHQLAEAATPWHFHCELRRVD